MKKVLCLVLSLVLMLGVFCSCGSTPAPAAPAAAAPTATEVPAASDASGINSDDIVILYTNDVHCAIDQGIGYAGLAAYKNNMLKKTDYVTLVDCGDHSQGDVVGALTGGEMIIDLMNAVGYDYAVLGNHEYDFGIEQIYKNVYRSHAKYLCCNLVYTGKGTDYSGDVDDYDIVTYGDKKVAFIGVSTPYTTSSTAPANFMEDGELTYNFGIDHDGADFYNCVQKTVDTVRAEGADYVVALAHLGTEKDSEGNYVKFSSADMVQHTGGIDVVLDGHSHSFEPCYIVKDKDDREVRISQTGSGFQSIGQLVITANGNISLGLITEYPERDETVQAMLDEIKVQADELLSTVAAHKDFPMPINDEEGIRMVRSREVTVGNLVADAYRYSLQCDIAACNGGGVRASMDADDITYRDIISVNPFGNTLCVVKLTGADICNMLEYAYRYVTAEYKANGAAAGESGSFLQISGLKCTIDTSVPSSVEVDSNDMLVGVGDTRRVIDVMVLQDGEYVPIEPDREYTFGTNSYIIKEGGCGMQFLMDGKELVVNEAINDYMSLLDYISTLGDFSAYESVEGRIAVK